MMTRKAEQYAARELKRRRAPRHGLSIGWVIFWSPLLWLLSALLAASLWCFPKARFTGTAASAFAFAFALGSVLFVNFPCRPIYIFGHEFTHWLAALLTGHHADFPRLGLHKGSVNILQPTLFIALAPYFLPFFLLISAIVFSVIRLCNPQTTPLFWNLAFGWLGLCYSYHIVLTILALARGQSDLQFRGPVLSYSVILFGNLLVLYLAVVLVSQEWRAAWATPWRLVVLTYNFLNQHVVH